MSFTPASIVTPRRPPTLNFIQNALKRCHYRKSEKGTSTSTGFVEDDSNVGTDLVDRLQYHGLK